MAHPAMRTATHTPAANIQLRFWCSMRFMPSALITGGHIDPVPFGKRRRMFGVDDLAFEVAHKSDQSLSLVSHRARRHNCNSSALPYKRDRWQQDECERGARKEC